MFRFETINVGLQKVATAIIGQAKVGMTELIDHRSESHLENLSRQTVISYHGGGTGIHDVVTIVRLDTIHATPLEC